MSGGIPVGFKLSAQHIEDDLDFALAVGADYVILDGRGGATGAAPEIFKNNISVPTLPALARARRHLDACAAGGNCPVGIATQQKGLRARLVIDESARRLANFLRASTALMQVLARA